MRNVSVIEPMRIGWHSYSDWISRCEHVEELLEADKCFLDLLACPKIRHSVGEGVVIF